MIVVLDNIRSCFNVGSIFRTSDAIGVEKIYLCGITPGPLDRFGRPNTKFTKVSLGAENTVSHEHVTSTARLITRLKKEGYEIVSLELHPEAIDYRKYPSRGKSSRRLALVLGGEVNGLSKTILYRSNAIIQIPMRGAKESLNVAVAFGIAGYHLA